MIKDYKGGMILDRWNLVKAHVFILKTRYYHIDEWILKDLEIESCNME